MYFFLKSERSVLGGVHRSQYKGSENF